MSWVDLVLVILINLVPVLGIVMLDWSVWSVLLLFWIENFLLGVITLLRILLCVPVVWGMWLGKLFLAPFFVVHYGLFCMVHLVFLITLFAPDGLSTSGPPWSDLGRLRELIAAEPGMALAALALAGGLLLRMLFEFVLTGNYRDAMPQEEMMKPYGRIVVLHVTVIISGVLVTGLGQPFLAVLVLVGLKLAVELGYWKIGESQPIKDRGKVEALSDREFAVRMREMLEKQ